MKKQAALVLALFMLFGLSFPLKADEKSNANYEVTMELLGTLPYGKVNETGSVTPDTTRPARDLYLYTSYNAKGWDWVMGMAMDFNRGIHRGRILSGKLYEEQLKLEMDIASDPWIKGGRLELVLSFKSPKADGVLKGTYEGTFRGMAVSGKLSLLVSRPLEVEAGFTAEQQKQHPRLLFRKADLPRLRERMKTPLGKAFVEKMKRAEKDPLANALLYQLTGEKKYADKAKAWVEKALADENVGAFRGAAGDYGKRVGMIAMVFDLCFDVWPGQFRKKIYATTEWRLGRMLYRPNGLMRGFNWSFNSNWSGHMNGGAGIAGLVMHDKQPVNPLVEPLKLGLEPRVFEADDKLPADTSVPVNAWENNKLPAQWVFAGPFPNRLAERFEIYEDKGGITQARPEIGDEITYDGTTIAFKPLHKEGYWNMNGRVIEFMGTTKRTFHSTTFLYTIIDVKEDMLVQYHEYHPAYLNGRRIIGLEPLVLKKGRHALMVRYHFYQINSWGKAWFSPKFRTISEEGAKQQLKKMRDRYLLDIAVYREAKAYSDANNSASANYRWLSKIALTKANLFHRYTFGDGGFQTEGETYTSVGSDEPILFETLYRNTFGKPSSGRPDVTHFGPRYIVQTIYDAQGIHDHQSFSLSDGSRNAHQWNVIFPATAPHMQGASLWAWNKAMGIENGGLGKTARERGDDEAFIQAITKKLNPVKGFLFYPMDTKPVHPAKEIPKVWEAKTKGLYVFRNEWKDQNDIVTQVFLKSEGSGGWQNPDAGTLRLYGLGHRWAHRGSAPGKTIKRWHESVVQLPEDDTNHQLGASLTKHAGKEDGSGYVSMNMDMLYMGGKKEEITKGKKKGQFKRAKLVNNQYRVNEDALIDLGIRGQRMFAVDYSKKSGAPALIAMADKITGGGKKIWTWQMPDAKQHRIDKEQVKITDKGFIIDRGDANLHVTFISPAKPNVRWAEEAISLTPANDSTKRKKAKGQNVEVKSTLHSIWVTDAENEKNGEFFAVITLQRKDAPEVKSDGKGMDSTVTVGEAKIKIEDGAILIK